MNTREEILQLTDGIVRRKGFASFSYADLSIIMDVAKPAIHHHFKHKEDLGMAIIDREIRSLFMSRLKWIKSEIDGAGQMKELVRIFYKRCKSNHLCLTGALAVESEQLSTEMYYKLREMCDSIVDTIDIILQKGLQDGSLRFEGTSKERATMVAALLASSLQLSRIMGGNIFEIIIDRMIADLGADFKVADINN